MPTVAHKKHFTFVGGLNTEASPLSFPPNTWADGDNVVPDADGSIVLRRAFDFEEDYALSSSVASLSAAALRAFGTSYWSNVGGDGNINFIVFQKSRILEFYVNSGLGVSAQPKAFTVDLNDFLVATNPNPAGLSPISVANVNGSLIVVSRDTEPFIIEYDAATDTISTTVITLKIRDFLGVDDGLAIDNRPASLSEEHKYNLLNQGWTTTHITSYFGVSAVYPSNAQSWTAGKDTNDDFSSALLNKQDFGTSPAPKGRFILDLFNQDRDAAAGTSGIADIVETYRPTTVAFYAGRAWYAGVRSPNIGTWVLFSQVAESNANLGKCYQDADPTSEVISDLVDSDGGVIPIQDAGTILHLMTFQDSLLVFCNNGVWRILGGGETGFSAAAYEVKQLSGIGALNSTSIVYTEEGIIYWAEDGIYAINYGQTGELAVSSISSGAIQTLYDDIPMFGKLFSQGTYVPEDGVVYWLFYDYDQQNGLVDRFKKNRLLCLDTGLKGYYTMTISEQDGDTPWIVGSFITRNRSNAEFTEDVVDSNAELVQTSAAVQVVATLSPDVAAYSARLLFSTIVPDGMGGVQTTFSEFVTDEASVNKFKDWFAHDNTGIAYTGFVTPGYDFGADQGATKAVQAVYVHCFFRRTETAIEADGDAINPSSCLMRAKWDFADTDAAGKWSPQNQVYRHRRLWLTALPSATYDDGYPVVMTKNKVRGRGKALQLEFSSEANKDMDMLGWAITYVGNDS